MDAIRCTEWELAARSPFIGTNRTGEGIWPIQNLHRFRNVIALGRRSTFFFHAFYRQASRTPPLREAASYDLPDHPIVVSPR
jgi:hypothetical protein